MLEIPALYKVIGNVFHLSVSELCRTSCVAVLEGMGSVLNLHLQNRKILDVNRIETKPSF